MKYASLLVLFCAITATTSAQETSDYLPMYNGTFYDVAIKETPHVLSDVKYFIPIGDPITVDTTNTTDGYAPVRSGGWVSIACISSEKPTQLEIQAMLDTYHGQNKTPKKEEKDEVEIKIEQCRQKTGIAETDCICELSDIYKAKFLESGQAIDLKRHQRAMKACMEGE